MLLIMAANAFHIALKGYVGGEDFDRATVDTVLAENRGKTVNVLIDSLGGSLATGLSISAAFKFHGKVNVHFVGLNASAATIASLGAAHVSIDAGAMYLVHKCSMPFFEWASLNSDQFSALIRDCEQIKADLDKLDQNCARLYAARCKRKPEELLALMKVGGWLSAKEALEWGFVDEVTDLADEPAPRLTDSLASAMASAGMPIPNIPVAESERESAFGRFIAAITSLFNPKPNIAMSTETTAPVATTPEAPAADNLEAVNTQLAEANARIETLNASLAERDAKIAELESRVANLPAAHSAQVVDDSHAAAADASESPFDRFCDTVNSARALFNEV